MDRLKALVREPALLIDAFESLVVVLVALGLFSLSGDQQVNVIGVFIALMALAKGFTTRPFPVTVIPDFGRALLVFCVSLDILHMSADQVTLLATFLGTLMAVVQRAQITPRTDPIARPGGAGSGPLAGRPETGAANLVGLGYVLVVLGAILIVVSLLTYTNLLFVGIVLVIVGVVLVVISSRRPVA